MAQNSGAWDARALYGGFFAREVPAAAVVLDDASLLHIPGNTGLAGDYQGREAILGLLRRMAELTGGTLQFSPSKVVIEDDQAIVLLGRVSAIRKAKRLDTDVVHVFSLRDGKVREIWIFHQNQDHVDRFWS